MAERTGFIHSYLSDNIKTDAFGNLIPDKPTRACMVAASELFRRGEIDKIALSVTPELSKPIVNRLLSLLPKSLKSEDIISNECTTTTTGEACEIRKIAEEKYLNKVTSICIGPHKRRVENNVRIEFGKDAENVEVIPFDKILMKYNSIRYKNIVENSKSWKETIKLSRQEEIVKRIEKIPLIGQFIVYKLPDLLPEKIRFQKWLLTKLGRK